MLLITNILTKTKSYLKGWDLYLYNFNFKVVNLMDDETVFVKFMLPSKIV